MERGDGRLQSLPIVKQASPATADLSRETRARTRSPCTPVCDGNETAGRDETVVSQSQCTQNAARCLRVVAEVLGLPGGMTTTALVFLVTFYARRENRHATQSPQTVIPACIFLASKIEERPTRISDIVNVLQRVLHPLVGDPGVLHRERSFLFHSAEDVRFLSGRLNQGVAPFVPKGIGAPPRVVTRKRKQETEETEEHTTDRLTEEAGGTTAPTRGNTSAETSVHTNDAGDAPENTTTEASAVPTVPTEGRTKDAGDATQSGTPETAAVPTEGRTKNAGDATQSGTPEAAAVPTEGRTKNAGDATQSGTTQGTATGDTDGEGAATQPERVVAASAEPPNAPAQPNPPPDPIDVAKAKYAFLMTETQLLKKQGFGPKDARVNAAARWAKSEETRVRAIEAKAFEEAKAKKKKAEEEETRRREEEAKALEEANKKAEAEALKKKEEAEAKALEEAKKKEEADVLKKKEEEAEVLKKQAEAKREEAAALARRVTERRTPSGAAAPSTGTDTKTTLAAVTAQADASEPDPNAKLASPVVGEAYYKTKAAILETEQLLLFALDSRVNVLNPHRILLNLFKTLGLPKHVAQIAFTGLTDLLFDTHLSRTKLAKRLYDGVIEGACYYL